MCEICLRIGMMDCWNGGIMGIKIGNNRFFVFLLLTPSFHYSNVPVGMFQTEISRKRILRVNLGTWDCQIGKA